MALAQPLGTRVEFHGPLDQEDLAAVLRKAHLAVQECPFCFTTIPIQANRCPHCTSQLSAA